MEQSTLTSARPVSQAKMEGTVTNFDYLSTRPITLLAGTTTAPASVPPGTPAASSDESADNLKPQTRGLNGAENCRNSRIPVP